MSFSSRPKLVTLLSLGVLTLTTIHWARFALAFRLPALPLTVPYWYIPLTGAVWGTAGLVIAIGLFSGRRWARGATLGCSVAYTSWYWADRLLLVQGDYAQRTQPASMALTVFGLAAIWLILRRRNVRQYYREKNG
ncbi:MAG: hypothetical protein WBR18_14915 [Anaerolineales bacterium]